MKTKNNNAIGLVDAAIITAPLSLNKTIFEGDIVKITYHQFLKSDAVITRFKMIYNPYHGGKFLIDIGGTFLPLSKIDRVEKCTDTLCCINHPKLKDIIPYCKEEGSLYFHQDSYHGNRIYFQRSMFGYTGWVCIEV